MRALIPQTNDRFHILVITSVIAIVLASTGLAFVEARQAGANIRSDLTRNSQIAAAALDTSAVLELKGNKSDEQRSTYRQLKARLAQLKKTDHRIRSIYITGERDGRLFFYVDSETPDSPDYSPAGEYYDDATPEFKGVFGNGQSLVEGPVSDSFGTFISGLAPMYVPGSQKVRAVLGIDLAASTYWRDIIWASAIPVTSGISIILLIIVFESLRRRNTQIMNVRSELVSVASHELRTPIVGIRWASEGLVRLTKDPNALKLVHAIKNSADGLQASTDDILELSHAMTRRDLNPQPTDLTLMIKEIMDTQRLSADQKNVKLLRDPSWPDELLVTCDANKMKRVLHNVISNCIKYTRENTEITTSYTRDKHMHRIHITDQGIGIPKSEQTKVMKGFYRASNAVASKVPGTGLGLYLVKTVLEQHGGSVRFDSEENKGTTVTLSLPG